MKKSSLMGSASDLSMKRQVLSEDTPKVLDNVLRIGMRAEDGFVFPLTHLIPPPEMDETEFCDVLAQLIVPCMPPGYKFAVAMADGKQHFYVSPYE